MSSRAELREAVRRLREAATARAVGRLGTGAGTRADQEALRRIARDTLREILPGELAELERPSPPEAGTASRLAALERRLERLEARLGPRPAEERRPAARTMVFLPAPWEAGRRLPGAAGAALLAGLLLLGAAGSAGYQASVRAEPGTTP